MRVVAAVVIWLSGGYLIWQYLVPIIDQFQQRFDDPENFQALSVTQILDLFAMPFFLTGILLWVALPKPKSPKARDRRPDGDKA